jgi:hypothetical protein
MDRLISDIFESIAALHDRQLSADSVEKVDLLPGLLEL